MGALELAPTLGPKQRGAQTIDVNALVQLAEEVLLNRDNPQGHFDDAGKARALQVILRVGTSAGDGFEYWLLKFDGVNGNRDRQLDDAKRIWRD